MARRFDQSLHDLALRSESSRTVLMTDREEAQPGRGELHVLREPVRIDGVTFVQCSCGFIGDDVDCALPTECPLGSVESDYLPEIERLQTEYRAAVSRKRSLWKASALRFALARVRVSA